MSRKPRIHLDGGFYHVICRGNSRQDLFLEDTDRHTWQSIVRRAFCSYGHRLHAFCWMTNHVHMAIQAGTEPLGKAMAFLMSQYARWFNLRYTRSGHLFERRYRAILVQEEQYLKELVRYIHCNPVRAGMVASPNDYAWSSHNAYMGRNALDYLVTEYVLALFGARLSQARSNYRAFMTTDSSADITQQLRTGCTRDDRVVGDSDWRARTTAKAPGTTAPGIFAPDTLDELVQHICTQHDVAENQLAQSCGPHRYSAIRAEIALRASEADLASISEVARRFNRSQPSLSRAVQKLRKAIKL